MLLLVWFFYLSEAQGWTRLAGLFYLAGFGLLSGAQMCA